MAKKAMRANPNPRNRPEQLLIAEILERHIPGTCLVRTEETVNYVNEFHESRHADIDIFIVYYESQTSDNKPWEYLIRVMGEYHDPEYQRRKDEIQKGYLEALKHVRKIRAIIDLWYTEMPMTFKRRDGLLKKSEAEEAYQEVYRQLIKYFPLPKRSDVKWLSTSRHIMHEHTVA